MRIVFWQNCLSPHQLPYIVCLLEDKRVDEVVIVAEEAINRGRMEMGWDTISFPGVDRCEVYLSPAFQTIDFLLSKRQSDSWHLFSGIRGFRFVFNVFKCSLKYNLKRGLITERPYTFAFGLANGKPLWLHRLRFFLQDKKFVPAIQIVFAMGDEAVHYFQSVGKHWQVFPFAYCTHGNETKVKKQIEEIKDTHFIYVASLSQRKSPISILKAGSLLKEKCSITFIGEGEERSKLELYVRKHQLKNVCLKGAQKNSEISTILSEHDVLILPSIYDGWGAVVNEALMNGLYVICSDKCGAKELLTDKRCGKVFHGGNDEELSQIMQCCIEHITEIRANRSFRQSWAQQCISGRIIASYMVDCLEGKKTERPWFKVFD